MKILIAMSALLFAVSSCSQATGPANTSNANRPAATPAKVESTALVEPEIVEMTAEQRALADAGAEVRWDDEDISWTLPKNWKKLKIVDRLFKYGPSDDLYIHATILVVAPGFDTEASLRSTYDGAVAKVESGEYEKARMVQIDGISGVEWIEAGAGQGEARRHQWIAFRKHNGKSQQLNVILAAPAAEFDKQRDQLAAVMYSAKIAK
jgi:hypothetical protein